MIPHADDTHHPDPKVPAPAPPPVDCEDYALWQRAVEGNEEAFAQLFRKHYAAVRGLSARLLLNLAAAEDVAQETFVRAARALPSISGPTGFRSWLYRVATNLCRDRIRNQARRRLREEEFSRLTAQENPHSDERVHSLLKSLARLPHEQREAIVLVYYENLNHAAAARVAGCATTTISWRIMLAKRKLKSLLTE